MPPCRREITANSSAAEFKRNFKNIFKNFERRIALSGSSFFAEIQKRRIKSRVCGFLTFIFPGLTKLRITDIVINGCNKYVISYNKNVIFENVDFSDEEDFSIHTFCRRGDKDDS